ncbi:MAG: filamentous hemagglutinin N-terminal domain-containing protein [Nostocaceae cyanobacterium]|nr:filamentous hemagglutinin N-terminal domain-containing protein [Nostocaceae cyanobacterium]
MINGVRFTKSPQGRNHRIFPSLGLLLALGVWGIYPCSPAFAQIVVDDTLGNERSVVNSSSNIRGLPAELIQGGATRGENLFHSFREFNVNEGQRVYFANPSSIENILSRVTGKDVSNILGTLGVDGSANLFLLNPNGIIFAENARLDVNGSFVVSTANSFVFPDGSEFSATNPQAPPLLKINLTPGLQYGQNPAGNIVNKGNLVVGQNLTLAGNNLNLQGQLLAGGDLNLQAQDTLRIRDSAATPFIAAAGGNMVVQGNQGVDIFALNHPHSGLFSGGDMVLRSANSVGGDVHFWSGGSFRIEQLDGSLGNLWSPNDPIIRANGNVSFDTYRGASLHIFAGGSVNLGSVTINGTDTSDFINETVTLSDGVTTVAINGSSKPTLDVRAGTTAIGSPLGLTGSSTPRGLSFASNTTPTADINIGRVSVDQPDGLVFLTNQYQPNAATSGAIQVGSIFTNDSRGRIFSGNSGDIFIDSRGDITLTSFGAINTTSLTGDAGNIHLTANEAISLANGSAVGSSMYGAGRGGNINIRGRTLSLRYGAVIASNTLGSGRGGDLNITTSESVQLTGTSFLQAGTAGAGDAGDLTIKTGKLTVRDGGIILTGTFGQGQAGNLTVVASDGVELIGVSNLFTGLFTSTLGTGNAGDLKIETTRLTVRDGAEIASGGIQGSEGNAGNLTVKASEFVELVGVDGERATGLFSGNDGQGDSGELKIDTRKLVMRNGAVAASGNNTAEGQAAKLTVNASESVELIGTKIDAEGNYLSSGLFSDTEGSADGADLNINTKRLLIRDGGQASAGTSGNGRGGNLTVNASELVEITGTSPNGEFSSWLRTRSNLGIRGLRATGDGGNLTINTQWLILRDGGQLSVSTVADGNGGNLTVNASDSVEITGDASVGYPSYRLNSGILAQVLSGATGNGGNIEVKTRSLSVKNGGRISTDTSADGNAGIVKINATNDISLDGVGRDGNPSGVFSSVSADSVGNGGSIDIKTPLLSVNNAAGIGVNSEGSGQAGNIQLGTDSFTLDNKAFVSAETTSNQGGNINIDLNKLLLMRNNSRISTTAGTAGAGGDGGKITINAKDGFLVTVPKENNDITANAFNGKGGEVIITAQGIFGFVPRSRQELVTLLGTDDANQLDPSRLPTSDITAISQNNPSVSSQGTVAINTPDTDPNRGLTELPSDIVDASQLIRQDFCTLGRGSQFIITGKGGITPSPNEPQSAVVPWDDLRLPTSSHRPNPKPSTQSVAPIRGVQRAQKSKPERIVEAQGFVVTGDGQVLLTASPAKITPQGVWLHPLDCQLLRDGS